VRLELRPTSAGAGAARSYAEFAIGCCLSRPRPSRPCRRTHPGAGFGAERLALAAGFDRPDARGDRRALRMTATAQARVFGSGRLLVAAPVLIILADSQGRRITVAAPRSPCRSRDRARRDLGAARLLSGAADGRWRGPRLVFWLLLGGSGLLTLALAFRSWQRDRLLALSSVRSLCGCRRRRRDRAADRRAIALLIAVGAAGARSAAVKEAGAAARLCSPDLAEACGCSSHVDVLISALSFVSSAPVGPPTPAIHNRQGHAPPITPQPFGPDGGIG
jgi:hypothetical protein